MYVCKQCQHTVSSAVFGWSESQQTPGMFCSACERLPIVKISVCRESAGSRTCLQAKGREHIHTSIGPLYVTQERMDWHANKAHPV